MKNLRREENGPIAKLNHKFVTLLKLGSLILLKIIIIKTAYYVYFKKNLNVNLKK